MGRAAVAILTLLAFVALAAACQDGPHPDSQTATSAVPAPTTAPAEPAPSPVSGTVRASNIQFPTPPPSPTPEATSTPAPAAEIVDLAREKLEAAAGLSFDISFDLTFVQDGQAASAAVTYTGNARSDGYSSSQVTVAAPGGAARSEVIILAPSVYVLDDPSGTWDFQEDGSPYFVDLAALLWLPPGHLSELEVTGRRQVDGVNLHLLEGRLRELEIAGARGDFDIAFWIGVADGLLRRVTASGSLDVEADDSLIAGIRADAASVDLVADLSGHGRTVDIVTPELLFPRYDHEAIDLPDGRILVAGGFTGIANNNVIVPFFMGLVQVYDPVTGMWSALEPLEGPGLLYSVIGLGDGRVLFVGLEGGEGPPAGMASVFDPRDDSWTRLPPSPSPRGLPALALLGDGRVMVAGGFDVTAAASPFSSPEAANVVEILDPETGVWVDAAPLIRASPGQWLLLLGSGEVLALGALRDGSADPSAHAEVYRPDTDTWKPTQGLESGFAPVDAVVLADGRVLAVGTNPGDGGLLPGARVYDPADGTWTAAGEMAHARPGATLLVLSDGRVLAVGGEDGWGEGFPVYSTTEILDPGELSWSLGPDLSELRASASASLLSDGAVLLAGGIGMVLDIEEIYPLASTDVVDPDSPGMGAPSAAAAGLPDPTCDPVGDIPSGAPIAPQPDLPKPREVLDAAQRAMESLDSYRLRSFASISPGSGVTETIRMAVDVQGPDRIRLCRSQSNGFQEIVSEVVRIGDTGYVRNPVTGEWESFEPMGPTPDFIDFLADGMLAGLRDPTVDRLAILGGEEVYRVSASAPTETMAEAPPFIGLDLLGGSALEVLYHVGADDFLIRGFVARGRVDTLNWKGADLFATVEISDFGQVRVEAPSTVSGR